MSSFCMMHNNKYSLAIILNTTAEHWKVSNLVNKILAILSMTIDTDVKLPSLNNSD